MNSQVDSPARILVWDFPIRLSHWLMAGLIGFSWWSGENRLMDYHRYSGYALLAVLTFRIYWGFAGSESARFGAFIRSPRATLRYLLGRLEQTKPAVPGHSPLGAWSVMGMLVLMLTQVTLGLFSVDIDGIESGPLSSHVSFDMGRVLARWHGRVFNVLLVFVGLHIAAVLYYLVVKRRNLVVAMLTGSRLKQGEHETSLQPAAAWKLWIGIAIAATLAWVVISA